MQMHFVYSGTTPEHFYMGAWKMDKKMAEKRKEKELKIQQQQYYRQAQRYYRQGHRLAVLPAMLPAHYR